MEKLPFYDIAFKVKRNINNAETFKSPSPTQKKEEKKEP